MKFTMLTTAAALSIVAIGARGGPQAHAPATAIEDAHVEKYIEKQEDPFIRMNTPLDAGEFTVTVEQLPGRESTRLTLIGKMWDAGFEGEGVPSDAYDAKLVFVFADHGSDIGLLGPLRTWQVGDTTELYSAESLAPDAALWTKKTAPELGSIEVWNSEDASARLTDSAVVSLFHAMVLPEQEGDENPEGVTCTPSSGTCHNNAKNACTNGIASYEYHCEEGSVTCKYSCHAPPIEPGPE